MAKIRVKTLEVNQSGEIYYLILIKRHWWSRWKPYKTLWDGKILLHTEKDLPWFYQKFNSVI